MHTEPIRLLDGQTGRDFVQDDGSGAERFSARLMDGSTCLAVTWTDNLPRTVRRLRDVQQLAGGPGSFTSITGMASDQLEAAILAGTFDADQASRMLGRSFGGNWRVQAFPRSGTVPPVFDVIAERIED